MVSTAERATAIETGMYLCSDVSVTGTAYTCPPDSILYVDAANSTAVNMYERLGYRIHTTSSAHHIQIPTVPSDAPTARPEPTR